MKEQSRVQLSKQERRELQRLLQSGLQPVRTVLRALALRQMAAGQTVRQVAKNVGLTPKTVWLTSQRYRQGGLERALYERPRPGKAALLGTAPATHRSPGLWSPAGRPLALDGAPAERRSGKAQTGSARGTGDHPRPVGKSRPKAVAGKKCGAWRNWMRSISSPWRTFWRCMRSRGAIPPWSRKRKSAPFSVVGQFTLTRDPHLHRAKPLLALSSIRQASMPWTN